MFKKVLAILALLVAVLVIAVVVQPADFNINRTMTISAPAAAIFEQINDFHKWDAWSPWAKIDPAMKQTYSGPPEGVGGIYDWIGNSDVGEGRMTITESQPHERIRIKLEFIKPFAATNTTEFTFRANGDKTVVIWSMFGTNDFMSKAMSLFMNMDKMIGTDFEKGLTQLKSVTEAASVPAAPAEQ